MDGKIVIGTEIDDKEFYKKIKEIESTEKIKIEIDPEMNVKELEKEISMAVTELSKIKGKEIISQKELANAQGLVDFIERANERIEELGGKPVLIPGLSEAEDDLEDISKKDFSKMRLEIEKVGSSLEKVTRRIGKMALAVFGIRSAFMFVRNAINTIANNDEKLKADIEYIRTALAYTLEPIVRAIVNLAKQLLSYLGYIIKAWTGRDIFASTNKSLKNANGQAKKLQKTLAGFDEMNVLNDSSASGAGGGSAGFPTPTDADVPGWIKFIAENKDGILAVMAGVTAGLTAWKLGLEGIQSLGIGLIVTGLVLAIKGIVDFIKDPSWNNFLTVLEGIALVVAGIAILMGGWIVALVALGTAIIAYVIKNWDKVKEILGKVGSWIYDNVITPVANFFAGLWQGLKEGAESAWGGIKSAFSTVISFFSNLWNKIKSNLKAFGAKVGEIIGSAFKATFNGIMKTIETFLNAPIKAINSLIKVINKVPGIELEKLSTFKLPRLAKGGIVNMPGRGVPVGGALAGEVNREGVIPLTDSQQMALLGEAIGKYITINANIVNTMNGRVISRELQRVQNDSDFAFNR